MYSWELRLSKKVDIWIVVFFWSITIFNIIANFIVYSTASSYDLYGATVNGVEKAIITASVLIPLSLIVSIVFLGDRLIARKNFRVQSEISSEFIEPLFNFKKHNIIRIILLISVIFYSLPWITALVGVYVDYIPGLNLIFLGSQPYNGLPAVHLGEHHGFGGFLYVTMAIVLSFSLDSNYYIKNNLARSLNAGSIAIFGIYGFIGIMEDGMNEQLLKRGIDLPIYHFFSDLYRWNLLYPALAIIGLTTLFLWFYFSVKKNYKYEKKIRPIRPTPNTP